MQAIYFYASNLLSPMPISLSNIKQLDFYIQVFIVLSYIDIFTGRPENVPNIILMLIAVILLKWQCYKAMTGVS